MVVDALVEVEVKALELTLVPIEIEVETLKIINNRNLVTQGLICTNTIQTRSPSQTDEKNHLIITYQEL